MHVEHRPGWDSSQMLAGLGVRLITRPIAPGKKNPGFRFRRGIFSAQAVFGNQNLRKAAWYRLLKVLHASSRF